VELDASGTRDYLFVNALKKIVSTEWSDVLGALPHRYKQLLYCYTHKTLRSKIIFNKINKKGISEKEAIIEFKLVSQALLSQIRLRLGIFNKPAYTVKIGDSLKGKLILKASSLKKVKTEGGNCYEAPVLPYINGKKPTNKIYYHKHLIDRLHERFPFLERENLLFTQMIWVEFKPYCFQIFIPPRCIGGPLHNIVNQNSYWVSFGAFAYRLNEDCITLITYMPPGYRGSAESSVDGNTENFNLTKKSFLKEISSDTGIETRSLTDEEFTQIQKELLRQNLHASVSPGQITLFL
jgi:hypothetical protein